MTLFAGYRWFSWGVASLPEFKDRGLCLAQLHAKYRLVSAYIESLPLVLKDKKDKSYCFSQSERFAIQLPLDGVLALQK